MKISDLGEFGLIARFSPPFLKGLGRFVGNLAFNTDHLFYVGGAFTGFAEDNFIFTAFGYQHEFLRVFSADCSAVRIHKKGRQTAAGI